MKWIEASRHALPKVLRIVVSRLISSYVAALLVYHYQSALHGSQWAFSEKKMKTTTRTATMMTMTTTMVAVVVVIVVQCQQYHPASGGRLLHMRRKHCCLLLHAARTEH